MDIAYHHNIPFAVLWKNRDTFHEVGFLGRELGVTITTTKTGVEFERYNSGRQINMTLLPKAVDGLVDARSLHGYGLGHASLNVVAEEFVSAWQTNYRELSRLRPDQAKGIAKIQAEHVMRALGEATEAGHGPLSPHDTKFSGWSVEQMVERWRTVADTGMRSGNLEAASRYGIQASEIAFERALVPSEQLTGRVQEAYEALRLSAPEGRTGLKLFTGLDPTELRRFMPEMSGGYPTAPGAIIGNSVMMGVSTTLEIATGVSIARQYGIDSWEFGSWSIKAGIAEGGTLFGAARGWAAAGADVGVLARTGMAVNVGTLWWNRAGPLGSVAEVALGAARDKWDDKSWDDVFSWNSHAGQSLDSNKWRLLGAGIGTIVAPELGIGTGIGYGIGSIFDYAEARNKAWRIESPAEALAGDLNEAARREFTPSVSFGNFGTDQAPDYSRAEVVGNSDGSKSVVRDRAVVGTFAERPRAWEMTPSGVPGLSLYGPPTTWSVQNDEYGVPAYPVAQAWSLTPGELARYRPSDLTTDHGKAGFSGDGSFSLSSLYGYGPNTNYDLLSAYSAPDNYGYVGSSAYGDGSYGASNNGGYGWGAVAGAGAIRPRRGDTLIYDLPPAGYAAAANNWWSADWSLSESRASYSPFAGWDSPTGGITGSGIYGSVSGSTTDGDLSFMIGGGTSTSIL